MAADPLDYGELESGRHCNYWEWDPTLRFEARRVYPADEYEWAEPVLADFGEAMGHTVADNADRVDRHPPELHTYDKHGEVVNEVEYHPKQRENEALVYGEFGLTHDAFHAPPGRDEPVGLSHVLTLQALLCYVDVGFACPASMTTGAALVIEKFDDGSLEEYFRRLTSRDPAEHVEGAMFLTEKQGGSDVGANEVEAVPRDDGTYALTGEKWFCSNIDAQGALVLARTPDAPEGTEGLSLFLVPRVLPDGELNDARFRRLKDKLGTLSVPTGEVVYEGATGYLVGEEEAGFREMVEMMNYERLTNATGAVGLMGRALLEAKVRAADREAFGKPIQEFPLMQRDLVEMTVDYEAAAAVSFEAARLLDERERENAAAAAQEADAGTAARGESADGASAGGRTPVRGEDSAAYKLMRLLIPVAKYKTARMSVDVASYACEVLGGNGAVREWVTPRLLRDAQILPIWEGTSNVLSLDLLRAFETADAHEALGPYVEELLAVDHPALRPVADEVEDAFEELKGALVTLAGEDGDYAQYHAKSLADLLFDVVAGALLVSESQRQIDEDGDGRKALVARLFVADRFGDEDAYGVASGETPAVDAFDAVARYGRVDPESLREEPAPADD